MLEAADEIYESVSSFFFLSFANVPAIAKPDLTGVWVLEGRAAERELVMTEKARSIQADYDLLNDDPSLEYDPASLSRVWANPNSRFKIEQALANRSLRLSKY